MEITQDEYDTEVGVIRYGYNKQSKNGRVGATYKAESFYDPVRKILATMP